MGRKKATRGWDENSCARSRTRRRDSRAFAALRLPVLRLALYASFYGFVLYGFVLYCFAFYGFPFYGFALYGFPFYGFAA